MSAPDIFLSYNREDAAVAKAYADAFAQAGLEVWWDATLRSGEAYDKVTEAALRGARVVVVLWSPRSVESRWVRAEATIADQNGTLMPATIEACTRPVMFELTQTADLAHWRGDAGDKAWLAFLGDVRRMVAREDSQPAAPPPAPAAAPSAAGAGVPQAGVLPFTFRGDDSSLEFLAEDLTEDITRAFAENDYFKVIAAGKMAAFRDRPHDYDAIGKQLSVRYLAEGKLQRMGGSIRLIVQLVDAETSSTVWSHRFSEAASEIANNPEDFSRVIAAELGEQMLLAETKRATSKPGAYTAWEHVVRAMAFSVGRGVNGPKGIEEARAAVAAAPDFGLAHAVLAASVDTITAFAGKRLDEALNRELHEHIAKALQLDGDNPAVLTRLWQAHIALGDGEALLRLAMRLVELRPHAPQSHAALSGAYFTLGRIDEAISASMQELNCKGYESHRPVAYWSIGWCHLLEGRVSEADAALQQSLALAPNMRQSLQFKAIAEVLLGKEASAMITIRRLRDTAPDASIEQHVSFMTQNPRLGRRSVEHIEILRRLWSATEPTT